MSWRDYSPDELEREYTPASCVENIQKYLEHYANAGVHSRQNIRHEKMQYGPHTDEWMWLAPHTDPETKTTDTRHLVAFVHGGFWRRLSADDGSFLTPDWQRLGFDYASINYSLCPKQSLQTLVDQTQRAIQFLQKNYDAANITLIGHSAGAHLIAMALSSITEKFARVVLVSGVFDLEPITRTSVNEAVQLNSESAKSLSPINFVSQALDTPLTIIWGENETGEFKRQSREFASAWDNERTHSPAITREISKRNHFDILYDLSTDGLVDVPGA